MTAYLSCLAAAGVALVCSASRAQRPPVRYTVGNLSVNLLTQAWGSPVFALTATMARIQELLPKYAQRGGQAEELPRLGDSLGAMMQARRFDEANRTMDRMLAILGQRGPVPAFDPMPAHVRERNTFLAQAADVHAEGIEDYIGWAVVERSAGRVGLACLPGHARAIRARGLKYIPYIWIQNLPKWVRAKPQDAVRDVP